MNDDSTTADILFSGDPDRIIMENNPINQAIPTQEAVPEAKPKPRVQINLEPTTQEKSRVEPSVNTIRMRGNVLIQNPSMEWKVRSCELNGSFLTFFRKQKMVAAIDLEQVGDINVLRQIRDSSGSGYIFSLHLKEGRFFNVRVTMQEDAQNWVQVLVDVRDKLRSHQSFRSKSFSVQHDTQPFTPMTGDFNTSLVADEPDDNIKVYFDSEQYPPSPILQLNEKYIRPVQSKVPTESASAPAPAISSTTGAGSSGKHKSGIPLPSSPRRASGLNTILAGTQDEEVAVAVEVRKGVDTSPWRAPLSEIAGSSSPNRSPNRVLPRAFTAMEGDADQSSGGVSPLADQSNLLGEVDLGASVATNTPQEAELEERMREEHRAVWESVRERKLEAERAKKAAAEKMAAEKLAEEERQKALKAARDAKEATERAAREKKMLADRAAKEAKIAADKAAEEERLAAEKAAKEAWMAAERAAREQKMREEKAVRAKLAAEKAAEEEKQRVARAEEDRRLAQERAVRIAEREAAAKKKLAEEAAAKEEAEREERQRVEEAARRRAQHRAAVAAERQSVKFDAGSLPAPGESQTGSLFISSKSVEEDNLLGGVEGVTMVDSPRSSFGSTSQSPGVSNANLEKSSPPRRPSLSGTSVSSAGKPPPSSPTGLRFPIRKVPITPSDPKASFYNADGSFKPVPKSPAAVKTPSPAGTPSTARIPKSPGVPTGALSQQSAVTSVPFPSEVSGGSDSAEAAVQYEALTTQNVANHTSSYAAASLPSADTSQRVEGASSAERVTSDKESPPADSESSLPHNARAAAGTPQLRRAAASSPHKAAMDSSREDSSASTPAQALRTPGHRATARTSPSSSRRTATKASPAPARYSSAFIFLSVAVTVVMLVLSVLGGVHYYNRYVAEEQWRMESLKHLQAINQNFRTAEDVSKPTVLSSKEKPMPSQSSAAGARPSRSSAGQSSPHAQPTEVGSNGRARPPTVTTTTHGVPSSAGVNNMPGVRVTTMVPADAQGGAVVRSNTMVKRFFRDLVKATARFVATVFSKFANLFK